MEKWLVYRDLRAGSLMSYHAISSGLVVSALNIISVPMCIVLCTWVVIDDTYYKNTGPLTRSQNPHCPEPLHSRCCAIRSDLRGWRSPPLAGYGVQALEVGVESGCTSYIKPALCVSPISPVPEYRGASCTVLFFCFFFSTLKLSAV